MTKQDIIQWLKEEDEDRLKKLWRQADKVRQENVGDEVHLRGLIEFSNYCIRRCGYCGLTADNKDVQRYRMSADEIIACAHEAVQYDYGTVVLQSGEDYGIKRDWLTNVVRCIKTETPLAVTLSVGERSYDDLKTWKEAGADRYLLRFETANQQLYDYIHPSLPNKISDRFEILRQLRNLGYEVGSGVMLGIPGQTYDSLADDLLLFQHLDLDMIGVGPFIPHPDTRLGKEGIPWEVDDREQVPNTELMTYKAVALTRILRPDANIPSTTALATLNSREGRELGLSRGANIVMPNMTPPEYRLLYEIYPAKACIDETAKQCHLCMKGRIYSIGRDIGVGQGGRVRRAS
ncbi:MAG: [FeFe] hydrogenase H-cluster radical SAM maturase HydE [Actinobacteria bacterium]|nr:[FeFe] hydrogenase H-cluster radical SAM maturase HydE [Actinomycetota bacterium]